MTQKIAFIATGGTITSIGRGPMDLLDYGSRNERLNAAGLIARYPEVAGFADVIAVDCGSVLSNDVYFPVWKDLAATCARLVAEHADLAGIVICHGTASLEETAYVLNLVLKVDVPVVLVGAQRPPSALSSDSGMNIVNAIRTAAAPAARGMGVMVLLNDEIHAAREVTKTSTLRLQTFRSPDFGALGHVDGDKVSFYRAPLRRHMPGTPFDITTLDALPRVDIAYAYAGVDGAAVRAFVTAGARGIVSAGFAPGMTTSMETDALVAAARAGVIVVQASRVGSGRVAAMQRLAERGFLHADNLNPQKARLLLALALTVTSAPAEIQAFYEEY